MEQKRIGRVIGSVEAPPCDQGCRWLEKCCSEHLACAEFLRYADTGKVQRPNGEAPSRDRYHALFCDKLVTASEAARRLGLSPRAVACYLDRHPDLVRAHPWMKKGRWMDFDELLAYRRENFRKWRAGPEERSDRMRRRLETIRARTVRQERRSRPDPGLTLHGRSGT